MPQASVSVEALSRRLQDCAKKKDVVLARELHEITKRSCGKNSYYFLASHLIRMFACCGSLFDANEVFKSLPRPNVYSWSALLSAHTMLGQDDQTIKLFYRMAQQSSVDPDAHVFVTMLKACSQKEDYFYGRLIHYHIIYQGLEQNFHIGSSLIGMYSKCGSLFDACDVFDRLSSQNTVTWSSMISAYVLHQCYAKAYQSFQKMLLSGYEPDKVTLLSLVKASSTIGQTMLVHCFITELRLDPDLAICNAIIESYSSYGSLENARRVFERLANRDIVTWSSMIAGYAQQEDSEAVVSLYGKLLQEGVEPNSVTFLFLVNVSSSLSAIPLGRLIHNHIVESSCNTNLFVGNALVEMYSNCQCAKDAHAIFSLLPKRDLVAWNSLISGYARSLNYGTAKKLFQEMREDGLQPNAITILSLLSACSQGGLVQEGCELFNSLLRQDNFIPQVEIYSCMIDTLGRSGHMLEAEDLLCTMPSHPNTVSWISFLGQCRAHGNLHIGQPCFENVILNEHRHASGYLLMLDMYSNSNMIADSENIEKLRVSTNAWKRPATAFIELEGEMYGFIVGDIDHPKGAHICVQLKRLASQIKKEGYVPELCNL